MIQQANKQSVQQLMMLRDGGQGAVMRKALELCSRRGRGGCSGVDSESLVLPGAHQLPRMMFAPSDAVRGAQ